MIEMGRGDLMKKYKKDDRIFCNQMAEIYQTVIILNKKG